MLFPQYGEISMIVHSESSFEYNSHCTRTTVRYSMLYFSFYGLRAVPFYFRVHSLYVH